MSGKKLVLREIREWVITLIGAFVLVMLLNTKVFATTRVQQSSMQDTLMEGQHLFVEKLTYNFGDPQKGDIVVFLENRNVTGFLDEIGIFLTDVKEVFKKVEEKSNVRLVKRVVGVPGDEVDIREGIVYVNDQALEEPYVKGETNNKGFGLPIIVPEGKYFVLGDNRSVSKDSRMFGCIDENQIEGRAVFRFWPMNRLGSLK